MIKVKGWTRSLTLPSVKSTSVIFEWRFERRDSRSRFCEALRYDVSLLLILFSAFSNSEIDLNLVFIFSSRWAIISSTALVVYLICSATFSNDKSAGALKVNVITGHIKRYLNWFILFWSILNFYRRMILLYIPYDAGSEYNCERLRIHTVFFAAPCNRTQMIKNFLNSFFMMFRQIF